MGRHSSEIERQVANDRARELRNNATSAERMLWKQLRTLKASGHKFRRQVPIDVAHFRIDRSD